MNTINCTMQLIFSRHTGESRKDCRDVFGKDATIHRLFPMQSMVVEIDGIRTLTTAPVIAVDTSIPWHLIVHTADSGYIFSPRYVFDDAQ